MTPPVVPPLPLPAVDREGCERLAADLRAAGFTADGVRTAWGADNDDAVGRGVRGPALHALGDRDDALAVLARLLVLGMPQDAASVAAALPGTGVEGLRALGLAMTDGNGARVVPTALVRPQSYAVGGADGHWWIASDLDEAALAGPLPEDHVLGVGGASFTLAELQLPTPASRALDLGTGCGIQALRAREHVAEVVATDISARGLAFARLNAALNGVDGIDTRAGSLFEPVAGERFDRVISNPPFVITPRREGVPAYGYRDGGMVGDALVASVIRDVGEHLTPGGVAQMLSNWETRDGVSGLARVRQWVDTSPVPVDAWVVERERLDPLAYAELWIRDGGTVPGTPEFDLLLDAWLEDFAARGVTGIGFGHVLLRRPAGGDAPTLARYETLTQALPQGGLGAHIAEALAAHDRLAGMDDTAVAASVLRVAGDVTEVRHHRPGEEDPTVIELRQGGGYARSLSVDPALAALVGACDGDLAVGVLIDAIAQLLEVQADVLRADLLPRVRELVFTGFLGFAPDAEGGPR